MTEYQIIDLYLNVSAKQDALWAVFFSVHMAIFGGIIYVDRPLKRTEKTFAIVAYLVFGGMNFVALRAGQRLMEALRIDLTSITAAQDAPAASASLFVDASRLILYQQSITLFIHLLAACLVLGAIIYDRKRPSRNA